MWTKEQKQEIANAHRREHRDAHKYVSTQQEVAYLAQDVLSIVMASPVTIEPADVRDLFNSVRKLINR